MTLMCTCAFCRALVIDDRPPAHYTGRTLPIPMLAEMAAARREPSTRRASRRGPIPKAVTNV